MSILAHVQQGVTPAGIRMVIGAQEKLGKTTICSHAPAPLLVPLEVGFAGVSMPKTPMLQNFEHVLQLLDELIAGYKAGQVPYRTICFDSATALERQIHNYIIRLDPASANGTKKSVTMESCHGGYGKGYTMANTQFDQFLQRCDILSVYYGVNIILTAHVFSAKVQDPTSGEYDSWDLLLHSPKNNKTYGKREMLTQWADVVGFLYEPIYVTSSEGKSGMVKGVSQNKGRVLAVSRTPSYTAGNRYGMTGEIPIPGPPQNGWNYFADALYKTCGIDVFTR